LGRDIQSRWRPDRTSLKERNTCGRSVILVLECACAPPNIIWANGTRRECLW
jgi:hypothetical protein